MRFLYRFSDRRAVIKKPDKFREAELVRFRVSVEAYGG